MDFYFNMTPIFDLAYIFEIWRFLKYPTNQMAWFQNSL